MTNIDRITNHLKDAVSAIIYAQLDSNTADAVLNDDRTMERILDLASAVDSLIEYGKDYHQAITDLESSGQPFDDGDIEQLLANREVSFPLK